MQILKENHFKTLQSTELFGNINFDSLKEMLGCLNAQIIQVKKEEVILLAGVKPEYIGIVLSGLLHIVKDDFSGNRTLVAPLLSGDLFAEALCCAGVEESPITVFSVEASEILLLRFDKILHTCPNSCSHHTSFIENMLKLVAKKNLMLQNRIEIVALKSVRLKVMLYLENLAIKQGKHITSPFNREELANYLCVERTALSHELSRMKKDGIIDYWKNHFELL